MNFIESCESIFNEIQELKRDLLEGKISPDTYALLMGGVSQQEKQQKHMIVGSITERKLKRKIPVDLQRGVFNIKQERHECLDRDIIVTREMCLDYSGEEKNHELCKSCMYFRINRNLIYPKQIKESHKAGEYDLS